MEMMVPMELCIALREHFGAPRVIQPSKPPASWQDINKTISSNVIMDSIQEIEVKANQPTPAMKKSCISLGKSKAHLHKPYGE